MNKPIESIKLVTAGAGAAALVCLDLLVELGLKKENIMVTDIAGGGSVSWAFRWWGLTARLAGQNGREAFDHGAG